ncbi:UNVERIFIED_ORG: high-affinity nickel permease [Arthrobacter sp. UYCu721]
MKALLNHHEREALPTARRLAVTFAAVAALHVVMLALLAVSLRTNHNPVVLGLLITAYLAGVKHSYDWDHIAAIDNSTRRFAAQGRSPVSVGFAFSMGHSMVVVLAGVLVVSGAGISPAALMALPFGFMAAMTLCDTVNGVAMMKMYGSAVVDPRRRIGFNMVITGVSAASALFISVITIAGVLHVMLGLTDPVTTFLAELDLGHAGLALVALLLFIWAAHTWVRRTGEAASATTRRNPPG